MCRFDFITSRYYSKAPGSGCWTLLYLSANNEWKEKAMTEVNNLIATHTTMTSSEPIHRRLSMIPVSAWEDEMPVVESIIRETLRLVKNDTALRRNLTDNLQVAGKTIDKGAFMAYNMGDVHLNELFYSDPLKFDPDRFTAPREEDKRGHTVFLGWGAGRHPCTGLEASFDLLAFSQSPSRHEICKIGDQNDPRARSHPLSIRTHRFVRKTPERTTATQSKRYPPGLPIILTYVFSKH